MIKESKTPDLVELTRRMLDAASNRDFDAMLSLYAADAEWDGSRVLVGRFEGAAAIRGFVEDWVGTFEEYGHEYEDGRCLGNGVVFAVLQLHGHLAGSPGRVRERYALTVLWAAGMIVRVIVDKEIDEARAAAERLAEERG